MAQHLSIRVPWKDNGYNGLVCDKPCYNNACLRLSNIAENKNDKREAELAGSPIVGHEKEIPCVSEGGVFMATVCHKKMVDHPYKSTGNNTHKHFLETELKYPPFTLPARPFGWTMLRKGNEGKYDNINRLSEMYNIDFKAGREPNLGFDTNWVQDATNQRAIFERFYENITPRNSLVIPYAKQVPFIEDSKRVIIGIGFVDSIEPPPEYNHTGTESLRSILWETMVGHSIRKERKDGFLLPYSEMMKYAEEHPDFDMRSVTVFAEDEYYNEFSYATEHLTHDAVISVLLQTIKVLEVIKKCIQGNWDECIAWTKARLKEVQKDRGAFPGAGVALYAMGFKQGFIIADEVKKSLSENESFVGNLEHAIAEPQKVLSLNIVSSIGKTEQNAFIKLSSERKSLFWLLARFSLTLEQMQVLLNGGYKYYNYRGQEQYKEIDIGCSASCILKNPYLIYENTRLLEPEFQIPFRSVDMAVFPPDELRTIDPLPEPSFIPASNDERRIRALVIGILERQLLNGHTVYPQSRLVADINEMPLDPSCTVSGDILNSLNHFFENDIISVEMKNGKTAHKLDRIQCFGAK